MLADLVNILKRLVVRVDEEFGRPEMTAETFDGPDDAIGFEVEGCPASFVVEGGAADEDDRADRAARLLLLESGANTVDAGVAKEAEMAGVVGDGVRVRIDQVRRSGEVMKDAPDDGVHFRVENQLITLLPQGVTGAEPGEDIFQEFSIVPNAFKE